MLFMMALVLTPSCSDDFAVPRIPLRVLPMRLWGFTSHKNRASDPSGGEDNNKSENSG